jgi:predicted aspartyl protease
MRAQNQPRPQIEVQFTNEQANLSITCEALMDTGASITCITEEIAAALQLENTAYGIVHFATPTGMGTIKKYLVRDCA